MTSSTKARAFVLSVAPHAGLFRADIFATAAQRRAVADLARSGDLIRYGTGSTAQYRIARKP